MKHVGSNKKNHLLKKAAINRKPLKKKKSSTAKNLKRLIVFTVLITICLGGYTYRHGILYFLGITSYKNIDTLTKEQRKLANLRIYEIVSRYNDKVFGIDISQYQGKINWYELQQAEEEFPLHYIFIRATAGKDKIDNRFIKNWKNSKQNGYLRGAYHYYRPDENSIAQADNFIAAVQLEPGDFPPVLDIEQQPKLQSMDSLKTGLQRWLDRVERYYGVKPIIYSGESYYSNFLKEEFADYKLWIANYSRLNANFKEDWYFWQFTDKARIDGITTNVDVNIYNGNLDELITLLVTD